MTNPITVFLVIILRLFLPTLTMCNTASFFTLVFSILLQQHISKLSMYFWSYFRSAQVQHHTNLCFKSRTLILSLVLYILCWWKESSCGILFCHGNPIFNFLCTNCIICYHAAQIVEMVHILQLFSFCQNLPSDTHCLRYFHIHFYSLTSFIFIWLTK